MASYGKLDRLAFESDSVKLGRGFPSNDGLKSSLKYSFEHWAENAVVEQLVVTGGVDWDDDVRPRNRSLAKRRLCRVRALCIVVGPRVADWRESIIDKRAAVSSELVGLYAVDDDRAVLGNISFTSLSREVFEASVREFTIGVEEE